MKSTKEKYKTQNNQQNHKCNKDEIVHKKRKRKKKAKKFFTIILFGLVIFFSFFVIKMNENGWTYGGFLATILGHNSKTAEKLGTVYIVVTGESQNLTDSIMLCAYNPKTQQASMMSIPRDTFTGSNQKKAIASDKINTLYQKSPEKLLQEINEITGLNIKYYVNVDTKGLREVIDAIGGIYFDVPIDMDYDDPTQNLRIHLKKGYQLLDGDKAEQVVRFRHNNDGTSYPSSYGDNDIGRMKTQREFVKVLIKQITNKNLLKNSKEYIQIAKKNVTTNFNLDKILDYLPYIIDFNMENLKTTTLPGEPKKCNGVWLYIHNDKETDEIVKNMFELDKNITVNQTISNDEESIDEEINIELLNGTSDTSKLKKVKELLEKNGYKVIKTGVTNSVSKTCIINKSDDATGAADKIKKLLNVGNITTGSGNENIDFTIIIGRDY